MSAAAPRKFGFDTVFDNDGHVSSAAPVIKRFYLPAEVEQIRLRAYAEGERAADASGAAALGDLAREIESRPLLKVQVSPGLVEAVEVALKATAEALGYPGSISVGADASLPRAAFAFDWGEGRAAFDPEAAATRVAAALETALAAEGLHAEPLTPESETDHG